MAGTSNVGGSVFVGFEDRLLGMVQGYFLNARLGGRNEIVSSLLKILYEHLLEEWTASFRLPPRYHSDLVE